MDIAAAVDAALDGMAALLGTSAPPVAADLRPAMGRPRFPEWEGPASRAAAEVSRELHDNHADWLAAHHGAVDLMNQAGVIAAGGRAAMRGVRGEWERDKAAVAPFGSAPVAQAALAAAGQRRLNEASRIITDTIDRLNIVAASLNGLVADLPRAPQVPPAVPTTTIPPVTTPVDEVRTWWQDLTPAERDALIGENPDAIGNLDGIPAADRDRANRSVMAADLARVDQTATDNHTSVEALRAHPLDYGLNQVDLIRYDNATKVRDGLASNLVRSGSNTFLLIYKPEAFDGQGRAAVAINNPDTAADVAVIVPGTSHSVADGWLQADDASNLYAEMRAADPGARQSVVAWIGYDAPDSFTDGRIASTGLAHEGASLLANDVNALTATHIGDAHITVIGHSYGSTVVADAAVIGMTADDVALIGSPGTDLAHSANDFHLRAGGHVYVGSASTDPITSLGQFPAIPVPGTSTTVGLGPDPAADGYGSTRFKAEVSGVTWNDHSHYYDRGSESAASLGLIAAGRGDQLDSHGLTAPPRPDLVDRILGNLLEGPLGSLPDLELPRLPYRPDHP